MSDAFYWAEFAQVSSGVVATPGGILTPGPDDIGTALVVDPAQSLQWRADKSSASELVLQPIAFPSEDEQVCVVDEAVGDGHNYALVAEKLAPVGVVLVAGQDHGAKLRERVDELEDVVEALAVHRQRSSWKGLPETEQSPHPLSGIKTIVAPASSPAGVDPF